MKIGDSVRVNYKYGSYVGKAGVVIGTNINVARYKEVGYETFPIVTVLLLNIPRLRVELQATEDKFDLLEIEIPPERLEILE